MKKLVAGLALGFASFSLASFAGAQTPDRSAETRPAGTAPSSLDELKELHPSGSQPDARSHAALKSIYKEADAQYKEDRQNCDKLSGNDKDICIAKARADRVRTKAEAEAHVNDTSSARRKALMDTTAAEYRVERAKCDKETGATRQACIKRAKLDRAAARYEPPTQEKAGTVQRPKSLQRTERAGSRSGEPAR